MHVNMHVRVGGDGRPDEEQEERREREREGEDERESAHSKGMHAYHTYTHIGAIMRWNTIVGITLAQAMSSAERYSGGGIGARPRQQASGRSGKMRNSGTGDHRREVGRNSGGPVGSPVACGGAGAPSAGGQGSAHRPAPSHRRHALDRGTRSAGSGVPWRSRSARKNGRRGARNGEAPTDSTRKACDTPHGGGGIPTITRRSVRTGERYDAHISHIGML